MAMATFVLIPGAGSDSWHWHLVGPELEARGHDVVAVDLPSVPTRVLIGVNDRFFPAEFQRRIVEAGS